MLKKYFELQKKIFNYFGYKEDWRVIPLEDNTEDEWLLKKNEDGSGKVFYHEKLNNPEIASKGEFYSSVIYTQRFLSKWVYRAKDFTMICIDTQCDGNKFLAVFDNKKEIKEMSKELKEYNEKSEREMKEVMERTKHLRV